MNWSVEWGKVMLETVFDDVWLVEGELVNFHEFPYPTRSVVVRLAQNQLWVWSPVRLTSQLRGKIDGLGEVRHLVSPNKIHHLYLADWQAAYPEALLWGPKSTIDKRRDLTFQEALTDTPPPDWLGAFDQAWFSGSPFMDEIVFYHHRSQTVIMADLSENFGDHFLRTNWRPWQAWVARIWGIVEGRGYAPLEWRLSFFDRRGTRAARDQVLSWKAERVIMAHGEWQKSDGHHYLDQALGWIG
jgi:hypothetical protein